VKLGLISSTVFLGVLAVAACGGDDGGSGSSSSGGTSAGGSSSGGGGAAGSSSGGGGAAGAPAGGASSGGSSSGGASSGGTGGAAAGGAGGSDLQECKAKAATNPDPACANCACDSCLAELKACEADATCVALRNCAQKNNCCDEVCVLLKCGTELQAAGGISGPGTTKAKAVKDCTVKATCNCCK